MGDSLIHKGIAHFLVRPALSETLEEGQELLWRPVAAWPSKEGLGLSESLLFEFQARVKVNLSRFHSFVPEPQSNDGTIHACLEKVHGRGVSKNVRRDTFIFQRRTFLACGGHVLGEEILNSVSTQPMAACIGEERIRGLTVSFA